MASMCASTVAYTATLDRGRSRSCFSDSLASNIAFGLPDGAATDERIAAASAVARLDKDVAHFPKGYATEVGERGLSGGQKQRAAIARAVILDAPILMLDDALSAVDTYTEEEILRGCAR